MGAAASVSLPASSLVWSLLLRCCANAAAKREAIHREQYANTSIISSAAYGQSTCRQPLRRTGFAPLPSPVRRFGHVGGGRRRQPNRHCPCHRHRPLDLGRTGEEVGQGRLCPTQAIKNRRTRLRRSSHCQWSKGAGCQSWCSHANGRTVVCAGYRKTSRAVPGTAHPSSGRNRFSGLSGLIVTPTFAGLRCPELQQLL